MINVMKPKFILNLGLIQRMKRFSHFNDPYFEVYFFSILTLLLIY